jgi:hypothetical protein
MLASHPDTLDLHSLFCALDVGEAGYLYIGWSKLRWLGSLTLFLLWTYSGGTRQPLSCACQSPHQHIPSLQHLHLRSGMQVKLLQTQ